MTTTTMRETTLVLCGATAAELMMPNPVSIHANAAVREAVTFLTDKGFSAAPVMDDAGHPVGVLSRADLIVHDRERRTTLEAGLPPELMDRTTVGDIMTPVVFSVASSTPASKVVEDLLGLHVHRLFVVDAAGVLIGVISAVDVLRHLKPEWPAERN